MARIARLRLGGWIGIIVSIVMLAWLAATYDLEDLIEPLQTVNYVYLLPIAGLVILNFAVRAYRWRSLFLGSAPRSMIKVFRAMMVGYLFNNLMPARAGDLVRVYQLSRDEGLSNSKTLATLVAERTGDLLVLIVLLTAVLLSYPALPVWLKRAGVGVGLVTVAAISTLMLLRLFGSRVISVAAKITARFSVSLASRVDGIGQNFLSGIAGLFNPHTGALFLALTGIIWSMELASVYLVAAAFKLDIPLGNLLFVLIAIAVGTLIPSSPGHVGTFEFFGVSALAIIGVTGGEALSFVVMLHAIAILGSGILGAVCLVGWGGYPVAGRGELRELIK